MSEAKNKSPAKKGTAPEDKSEKKKDYHQTLPHFMRTLTDEQIEKFSQYKHAGSKTPYEAWL